MQTVLITGGSGLVGKAIQSLLQTNEESNFTFVFLSSKDCDLRNEVSTELVFKKYNPDIVIHLASLVGGIYKNMSSNYEMLVNNLKINTNVLDCCRKFNVKRLINVLSTCVFGNNLNYPLTSSQILDSRPDKSNEGYSYSKRLLYTGSELLSKTSEIEIVNLIPTNLYGKHDNYNIHNSHVIPGLCHKILLAKQSNKSLVIRGTGSAMRQFVYANDFGRIILHFVNADLPKKFNSLIVGPHVEDEISIKHLVNKLVAIFDFKGKIIYDADFSNGQHKKTVSSDELLSYIPDFKFTPLDTGLKTTIDYFIKNYDTVRK
jgi:GDP-L-fucose synthase